MKPCYDDLRLYLVTGDSLKKALKGLCHDPFFWRSAYTTLNHLSLDAGVKMDGRIEHTYIELLRYIYLNVLITTSASVHT